MSRILARIELCQVPMLRRAATAGPVALSVIPILRRPIKNRKCVSHYVTYRRRSSLLFPSPPRDILRNSFPYHFMPPTSLFASAPSPSLESSFDTRRMAELIAAKYVPWWNLDIKYILHPFSSCYPIIGFNCATIVLLLAMQASNGRKNKCLRLL